MADFDDLPKVVLLITIVGVLGGISAILLGEFQDQQTTQYGQNNETKTTFVGNNWTTANSTSNATFIQILEGATLANTTVNFSEGGAEFNITDATGALVINGSLVDPAGTWNLSYSYELKTGTGEAYDVYNDGVTGIGELASWLDLMALVVAATIILGLVLGVLYLIRGSGGGNAY